jgi:LmbE family N-acetylglucosaminyl deacetylase
MGMGGTIARLVRAGKSVLIVSLTRGEQGTFGTVDGRAREAAAAAAILGCSSRLLDFPDTRIENSLAGRERLAELIRECKPRLVFAPPAASRFGHHDGAAHVDHLATGVLVRDALKLARLRGASKNLPPHDVHRLYKYMVPRDQHPSLLVDVTEVVEVLVEALRAYETQMQITRQGNPILDILLAVRRFHGIAAGCTYAEAFLAAESLRVDPETLFQL